MRLLKLSHRTVILFYEDLRYSSRFNHALAFKAVRDQKLEDGEEETQLHEGIYYNSINSLINFLRFLNFALV